MGVVREVSAGTRVSKHLGDAINWHEFIGDANRGLKNAR